MTDIENFLEELRDGTVVDNTFKWEYDNFQYPENFLEWFVNHGECFERYDNEKELFNQLKITSSTNNQCFQNTQLLALNNEGIKYYEGFVYGIKYKMTFHHGFNVINNKAIDVTDFYNKTFTVDEESNWSKEKKILYFGVHIPDEFLSNFKEKLDNPTVHNPLIFEYYNSTTK